MGRPPMIPPEKKTRIVLAILSREMSIAEAARKEKVSEQSIGRVEGGVHRGRQDRAGGGSVGAVKPGGTAGGQARPTSS
jgi:transposase